MNPEQRIKLSKSVKKLWKNKDYRLKNTHTKDYHQSVINKIFNGKLKIIGKYKNAQYKTKYKCLTHNNIFYQYPVHVSKGINGCNDCRIAWARSRYSLTQKEFEEKVNKFDKLIVIGKYISAHKKIKVKCKKCKKILKIESNAAMRGHGCRECSMVNQNNLRSYNKTININSNRKVKISGDEDHGYYILLKKYKENEILFSSEGKVPVIKGYGFKYYPDFYIKKDNLIVEVKSIYTFLNWFDKNSKKAIATIDNGFNIEFLVFDAKKNLLNLSNDWFLKSKEEVVKCL